MSDVVPLYYEMKKAKGGILNQEVLYHGMAKAYTTGNIGPISNNITKIWNCGKQIEKEQLNVVRWLCMENNFVIDAAKTLYTPSRPHEIDKIIKSYTKAKVPNFFQYAKDKTKAQVEETNNSPMNRLSDFIPNGKLKFNKTVSKFDYRVLMNHNCEFSISSDNVVLKSYDYWNVRINSFDEDKGVKNQDMYKYKCLREKIQEETGESLDYIVNTLVAILYTVRRTSAKKGLWDAFGDIILKNIENNIEGMGKVCPICGKRFIPVNSLQTTCSRKCHEEMDRKLARERKVRRT